MTGFLGARDWRGWSLAILTAIMSVVPRLMYRHIPFDRDEGAYAYMADVIGRGGLPYVNAFDHKFPLIYYLYHLSFNLFGHSLSSPRLLAAIFIAVASLLACLLVYRLTKRFSAALFSSLLLGLSVSSPAYHGLSANTELFTLPLIVGGILILFAENPPGWRFFCAGMVFGIGFLIKQPVLVIALFVCAACSLSGWKTPLLLFRRVVLFLAGLILPFLCVAAFFHLRGGLTAFFASSILYNFGYMGQATLGESLGYFRGSVGTIMRMDQFLWLAAAAGMVMLCRSGFRTPLNLTLAMIAVGSFLATAMGTYFYRHYFIFLFPVLVTIAGLGLAAVLDLCPGRYRRSAIIAVSLLSCFSSARFMAYSSDDVVKRTYHLPTFVQARGVGDYLRTQASPSATLFIVGSEPEIFFYSGLESATKVYYIYPLVSSTRMLGTLRQQTLAELVLRPPDYMLLVNDPYSLSLKTVAADTFVSDLLDRFSSYRLVGVVADHGDELVRGDFLKLRAIVAGGAAMLLLARPNDASPAGGTLGELLGRKGV